MLLAWHFLALGVAVMVFLWMIFLHRRARRFEKLAVQIPKTNLPCAGFSATADNLAGRPFRDPRSGPGRAGFGAFNSVLVVGRHDGRSRIFHQPARQRLGHRHRPRAAEPDDDVDACFLFLTALSRELGHVQFFHAEKFSHHHAWARVDDGCVTRAYAWAGETVWNQGAKTMPEIRLRLKCFDYGEQFRRRMKPPKRILKKSPRWRRAGVLIRRRLTSIC